MSSTKAQRTRRDLLKYAAGAGAALALPGLPQDKEAPPAGIEAIRRRRIPSTGELVPMVGLGTSQTFDVDPTAENQPQLDVVRGFFACGGALIDSSPMYRRSEAVVGALLERLGRDDAFVATKVWTEDGREAGEQQMQDSMRKMGTARIDLMQVHNLVDWQTHLKTLRAWKESGKIRYLGVTDMRSFDVVEKLIREEKLDFVQVPYSIGERAVEERILPAAAETGTAVLVMRPFTRGRLFEQVRGQELPAWASEFDCQSWAQYFLKFVLGHPAVTCPIPATSKPRHLFDNMKAGVGRLPDEKTRKRMVEHLGL